MSDIDQLVGVLKAAGEITRLRLLALLREGELSVKDLTEILAQSQPRISRHLKLLAEAGLVRRHAEGAWAYFAFNTTHPEASAVVAMIDHLDRSKSPLSADLQKLDRVRQAQKQAASDFFANVAGDWDRLRALHVPEEAVEQGILDFIGTKQVKLLLDLGTGTGRMLELLADRYAQGVGLDSSREMIGVARGKLSAAQLETAQIRLGDISNLADYQGQADLIIIHQVLHYFDDPGQILREAASALAPGGQIIIADFGPHQLEFLRETQAHRRLGLGQDQMAAWAEAAGLTIAQTRTFPSESGAKGLAVCLWALNQNN